MIVIEYTGSINLRRVSLIIRWVAYLILMSISFLFLSHDVLLLGKLNFPYLLFTLTFGYLMWDLSK